MNVIQELLAHLPHNKRMTPSGWTKFNCSACHHLGHKADQRQRGGVIFTDDSITFNCFNCHYIAHWQRGRKINYKMRKYMQWMGMSDSDINRLSLFTLAQVDPELLAKEVLKKELPKFEDHEDCPGHPIMSWFHGGLTPDEEEARDTAFEYIANRGLLHIAHKFRWTPSPRDNFRVFIPFTWHGNEIGYSGRRVNEGKAKYLSHQPPDYVFGYDDQPRRAKFCIVTEGCIDGASINALSTLGNKCTETQALIIESLDREVIVVPDRDKNGWPLVEAALEYGWSASFPEWRDGIKDVAKAVEMYGPLFTMRTIIDAKTDNATKIKLLARNWCKG